MGIEQLLLGMGYVPQGQTPKTILDNGEPGYHQTGHLENLSRAIDKFKFDQEQEQKKRMFDMQNKTSLFIKLREAGYSSPSAHKAVNDNFGYLENPPEDQIDPLAQEEITRAKRKDDIDYASKRIDLVQKNRMHKIDLKLKQLELEGKMGDSVDPEKMFANATTLRKEYDDLSKDFNIMRDSYSRVVVSAKDPSAAGDLALIFNYMKILDPRSVVRESEFATAENAAGVPEQIRRSYNKVLSGEKLGTDQRKDFVSRAGKLYDSQLNIQNTVKERFKNIAVKNNIDPYNLFGGQELDVLNASGGQSVQSEFQEGQTATNPTTGEKIIFRNGQWGKL